MFDINQYLEKHEIKFKGPDKKGFLVIDCPFCGGEKKMYLKNSEEGNWGFLKCFKCEIKPQNLTTLICELDKVDLKTAINTLGVAVSMEQLEKRKEQKEFDNLMNLKIVTETDVPVGFDLKYVINTISPVIYKNIPKDNEAIRYLKSRGLSDSDIEKSGAYGMPENCMAIINSIIDSVDYSKRQSVSDHIFKRREYKDYDLEILAAIEYIKFVNKVRGRVVFPVEIGKKLVGYVCRDYTKKSPLKVLNSEGSLTSDFFWNYNNVLKSKQLVICEGIFSATSCGIDRSIALLGKNINKDSKKIALIKTLKNLEDIVIYLDPGAYDNAGQLAESLMETFYSVRIVRVPTIINIDGSNLSTAHLLENGVVVSKTKDLKIQISYNDHRICKLIKKAHEALLKGGHQAEKKIFSMLDKFKKTNPQLRLKFFRLYSQSHHNKDLKSDIFKLAAGEFLDANDFSKDINDQLIKEAVVYTSLIDLNKNDDYIINLPENKKEVA